LRLLPAWVQGYERAWLVPDVLAGVIVWSVVTPQAVAYAQIAGLPPSAGLAAAPGALLAYSWLGTSRTLVVSLRAMSRRSAAGLGSAASTIDVGSLDMLRDLVDALGREGVERRLAAVHVPVLELLQRDGLADRVRIEPTLDAAAEVRP
jgi:MFS superfamily sulfate permease-like transporter